jgi:glycosyltransferase involved in cell wall biosynthesis
MILGIDASNIRAGGGVTHLVGLLAAAKPERHGVRAVRVWAPTATAAVLPKRAWLEVASPPALDRALPLRVAWQATQLPRLASACDVLFAPGGPSPYRHRALVSMSQNMLLFDARERRRYGASAVGLRLALLARAQRATFRRAAGVIFLTNYARREVCGAVEVRRSRVVSHGIDERFRIAPRPQRALAECSADDPFRIVYVSIVDLYKHQWHVAEAVAALRRAGLPVSVELVGPAYPPALRRLERKLAEVDPLRAFTRVAGPLPYASLPDLWRRAELCVFASSCENQPNILLEAMAAGLPVASSDRGPMPEVLGEAGVYFDPERPETIAGAIERLARAPAERAMLAARAHERAARASWARCAEETFSFLAEIDRGTQP